MPDPQLFATGFSWPEAPRWHDDALWISDVHNFRIAHVDAEGNVGTFIDVPNRPAGMDFTVSSDLLLANSLKPYLNRVTPDGETELLFDFENKLFGNFNDMVHGPNGWSWVGDTGFNFGVDEPVNQGQIFAFHPDHDCRLVADEVFFPNGMVVSKDGKTLFVCETFGKKITAFDIEPKGALKNRRTFAEVDGHPDGLCADPHGGLWVPLLFEGKFLKLDTSGDVVSVVEFPGKMAIACANGGALGRRIYLCVATVSKNDDGSPHRVGEIHYIQV